MSLYAELEILDDEEGYQSVHERKFLHNAIFSCREEDSTLFKLLTYDEYEKIEPYSHELDLRLQNPNEFKTIILKIKKQLEIDNLYNEYKKDFKDILFVCDKAIELNKQIYFTYSN